MIDGIDPVWLGEKLQELIKLTRQALCVEVRPISYDADGHPTIFLPKELIVHVLKKEARPIFAEIFYKLEPIGDITPDQVTLVKALCSQIFPPDDMQDAYTEIRDWFIERRNLEHAVLFGILAVMPMGATLFESL